RGELVVDPRVQRHGPTGLVDYVDLERDGGFGVFQQLPLAVSHQPVNGVATRRFGHLELLCPPLERPARVLGAAGPRAQHLPRGLGYLVGRLEGIDIGYAVDLEGPQARADLGNNRPCVTAGEFELFAGRIRHTRQSTGPPSVAHSARHTDRVADARDGHEAPTLRRALSRIRERPVRPANHRRCARNATGRASCPRVPARTPPRPVGYAILPSAAAPEPRRRCRTDAAPNAAHCPVLRDRRRSVTVAMPMRRAAIPVDERPSTPWFRSR